MVVHVGVPPDLGGNTSWKPLEAIDWMIVRHRCVKLGADSAHGTSTRIRSRTEHTSDSLVTCRLRIHLGAMVAILRIG